MNLRDEIRLLKRIFELLGPLRRMFVLSLGLMAIQAIWTGVVLGALGLFLQLALGSQGGAPVTAGPKLLALLTPMVDFLERFSPTKRILIGFGAFSLSMIAASLLKAAVFSYTSLFATRFIYRLRGQIFVSLCRSSQSYFDVRKKGELMQMMIHETRAHYTIVRCLTNALTHAFNASVSMAIALSLSWQLCLLVGGLWLILLAENRWLNRRAMVLSHRVTDKMREMMVITEEALGGIKHLKLLNITQPVIDRFAASAWDSDFLDRKSKIWIQLQEAFSMSLGLVFLIAIVTLNTAFHWLQIPSLILFIYVLYRLVPVLSSLNQELSFVTTNFPMAQRVLDYLDASGPFSETSGERRELRLLNREIAFQGVWLDYLTRKGVLHEVSLVIPRGKTVALVGPSGSGKTSLANLMVRLYEPTRGRIVIDDHPLPEWDLSFLRDRIGMVSQETTLFNMTVKENLLLAKPDATQAELESACRHAFAHDFVSALPHGYETLLGDRGVQLSGGQRQRLQLSQIFLKNPEILVLDEATSALDTESEAIIQKALRALAEQRTCLVIAHRLSTIRHADRIVVIEKGRVVEEGTWSALLASKGRFYDMLQHHNIDLLDDLEAMKIP